MRFHIYTTEGKRVATVYSYSQALIYVENHKERTLIIKP